MSTLYDITRPLGPVMPTWPGEPGPHLSLIKHLATDGANVTHLAMGVHTGTHIDAPVHFIDGRGGVETFTLEQLCGPARVIAISHPSSITVAELAGHNVTGVTRVLFKTKNGTLWDDPSFRKDYVSLSVDAAHWLVERGVRLVGVDYLSVEAFDATDAPVHKLLLSNSVAIVEGLDLRVPVPGDYDLWCLPLRLTGTDGAPVRAVLRG